ncbi:hypothetical protein LAG90_01860 [Marinilongibacter aquaticus]|uniref:hypothetical protein n=1 Tax=Marinilongibacter aquaticus TaxID=2975157 RepID=UPI0021BDB7D3|nr:hypothetical protein [Marinilongibacter aquaticus]UBM59402.1 hypothetical protein LAG90_01860 [Marinilongibacter aquaticus]
MTISITKKQGQLCQYKIVRDDESTEIIDLDEQTFFLHDITHFVVEKNLALSKGFWGLLAEGHAFKALFGKENQMTSELRFIEKIVGPVQSTFLGYIPKQDFARYIAYLGFKFPENILDDCLREIKDILKKWENLEMGNALELEWPNKL